MSDFQDRLRAADPAAASNYEHPDTNAMISRIMAQAPRARRHVLRSFQLRMAASVAVAAALTVGGIAALEGAAPSLAVFALAAPHGRAAIGATSPNATLAPTFGATSPNATHAPTYGMMRIYEEFNFTAGSDLSANPGTGATYQLTLPTSASAEDARIAAIFGVSGTPVNTNSDGQDFTVTDPTGNYVEYETYNTVPQWTYSIAIPQAASSTTSDGTTVAMPSQSTVEGDVRNYLGQLGYGYQVTDPQFSTSNNVTSSPGQPSVTANEESVSYSVTVDGVLSDQYLQFTVDANNNVVSANGPAFTSMPAVNYPLQSPAAGVEVLEAQQQSYFASNNASGESSGARTSTPPASGSSSSSPATAPSAASDTTDTTTTTPSGPPIVDVTLDAETISYQTYQLTDGSVWMLPIYNYTGMVNNSDGSSYTGTWSTIAVDPTYIQVSTSSSGGINPGGPILY
jgi:hypothetical protein